MLCLHYMIGLCKAGAGADCWDARGRGRARRSAFADWAVCLLEIKGGAWKCLRRNHHVDSAGLWSASGARREKGGRRSSFKQTAPKIGIKIPSVMLRRSPRAWLIM